MERMQFSASENRATIVGLEKTRDCLKTEIVTLNQRLAKMQNVIDEKDCLIAQYAQSLNKLYGVEQTEAVIKIQALRRGVVRRQTMGSTEPDEDDESDSSDSSDDDHHFDGDFENMDLHLSVNRRHHHGIKKRRKLIVKKRKVENYASDSQLETDETDLADLDREINAMLSDDEHELDRKLQEILGEVDIDDAISAATKIQALQRGRAGRADKQTQDDDDEEGVAALNDYLGTLSEAEVEKAVLKIQALARGRRVRTHMEAPLEMHTGPALSPDVEALNDFLADADEGKIRRSASKIQAVHRGNHARKQVHRKRKQEHAAVEIQRVYRGRHARTAAKQRRRGRLSAKKANYISSVNETEDIVLGPDE